MCWGNPPIFNGGHKYNRSNLGNDEYGDSRSYSAPETILCDYEGGVEECIAV